MRDTGTNDIAKALVAARLECRALPDYPGIIPATLVEAYAVQDAAIADIGQPVGGWKVGRILPPLSETYGANRLSGPIFVPAIQHVNSDASNIGNIYADGFSAAEAEFLLHIGTAPDPVQTSFTLDEAAALIERVHIGLEIASSPLPSINDLGPAVIISDFGNNNGLIVGPEIHGWRDAGFADWDVTTHIDGIAVGTGRASAFPDGPIGSLRFLLENLASRGISMQAGTWISSGAVTGVHPVNPGQRVDAFFGSELKAGCTIEAASPQKEK